jgi:hypothetical protein
MRATCTTPQPIQKRTEPNLHITALYYYVSFYRQEERACLRLLEGRQHLGLHNVDGRMIMNYAVEKLRKGTAWPDLSYQHGSLLGRLGKKKKKRIPFIFNDESTGS